MHRRTRRLREIDLPAHEPISKYRRVNRIIRRLPYGAPSVVVFGDIPDISAGRRCS